MQLPWPESMELADWENALCYALGNFIPMPSMPSDDWQHWGLFLFQAPQLAPLTLPNPYDFDDWRKWADRLVDALGDADDILAPDSSPGNTPTSAFILTQSGIQIATQDGHVLATQ